MSSRFVKLIMVTEGNNNKYYEMTEKGSTFEVKYGRVESTETVQNYPISKWDTKYNEKIRKGYVDMTHTVSLEVVEDEKEDESKLAKIEEKKVEEFLSLMKKYTDNLVSSTYSVKATSVTQSQVDEAQQYLDDLKNLKKTDKTKINSTLLKLYMVIPRRMGNVKDYLLPNINIDKTIDDEQNNLDAMASQVSQISSKKKKSKKKEDKSSNTLLDLLEISMKEIKEHKNIKYLTDQLSKSGHKIKGLFEINKPKHDEIFTNWMKDQKDKQTRYLLHGTKCTSVIPIIEQGLKIRPTGNFSFSGKAYGDGNYFSETCVKSLGYTGYDKDKVMFVYEVHVGNAFVYDGWYRGNSFALNYKELKSRGFDSTFVKAGGGLLNTEIIAYKEQQSTLRYVIWL